MPITLVGGTADVRAKLDALYGPIDPGLLPAEITALNDARDKLAESIAEAAIYVKTAGTVPAGIAVSTTGTAVAQTGATTAAGSID